MNEKLIIEVEARARQAITEFDRLDSAFKRVTGDNKRLQSQMWKEYNAGVGRATTGNQGLLASLKTIGPAVVGAFAVREIVQFADASLRATDQIAGVKRGLETVYGSAQRAEERFKELNEIAKFPGLDPAPLAKYDAIFTNLGGTAEDNTTIFTGTAKAVTTFGGNVFNVNSTLFQLSQAFGKNKIDAQDFKSVIEQTSGTFIKTAEETLGFTGGIEGMRKAFQASGDTLQEFLLPVFAKLNEEFEGAPVDSYTNAMDNLGVAFTNFTAKVIGTTEPVGKFVGFLTKFFENEAEVWENMRTGGDAIKAVGDAADVAAAQTQVLQKDIIRLNTALTDAQEKFDGLKEDGVNENTAAMQHLQRRIDALKTKSEELSGQLTDSSTKFIELLQPVNNIKTEFRVLTEDVAKIDTRFMTFRERSDALKGSIEDLPPEITAVRTEFNALAPTAKRVDDLFKDIKTTLVDVSAEEKALRIIDSELHEALKENTAPALKLTAHNAKLVDEETRKLITSTKNYGTTLADLNIIYGDTGSLIRNDVISPMKSLDEKTKDLKTSFNEFETSAGDVEEQLQNTYEKLDTFMDEEKATDWGITMTDVLISIGTELGNLDGPVADAAANLTTLFTNPIQFAGFTVASVLEGLFSDFSGKYSNLSATGPEVDAEIIGDPKGPFRSQADEDRYQNLLSILNQAGGIDFVRDTNISALHRPGYRERLEKDLPAWMFEEAYPDAPYNIHQPGPQNAQQFRAANPGLGLGLAAPTDDQERGVVFDPEVTEVETTSEGEQITAQPTPTGETPTTAETPAALGTVHRFTGAEYQTARELSGVIKQKRTDFTDLTNADFSTILDMYGEYTQAILNLYNEKVGVIGGADNIDGAAKSTAMGLALQEYNLLTYRANRDLEGVMAGSNLTLATEFGSTTGALGRNQILYSVDQTTTPATAETTTAETTTPATAETAPSASLGDRHRFTGAQSGEIRNMEGEAKQARTDFRNLTDADFSTILNKYGEYTTLLQSIYDKRIEFINNASGITEVAKGTARKAALIAFQNDTLDANNILARVMENSDLRLVNEFGATTGIIPRGQVLKGVVPGDARTGVVKATQPTYITATSPSVEAPKPSYITGSSTPAVPVKPLGESHRFTAAQSGEVRNMEGRAKQLRKDFRDLTDADFSTILDKYGEYTSLLQAIYDKRIEFINAAAGINEAAKGIAREAALIAFQNDTFEANEILSSVMGNSDLRLVNEFGATTGIIPRGQVIKGVVHGDARTGVVKATQPTYITGSSTPAAQTKPLGESHRFSSAQSGEVRNMESRAKQLRTDFRNLTDADFSTILTKYGEYTSLLQAIYDKRIEFINAAAGITEGAKGIAREAALIAFQNDTFEANGILSSVMAASGGGLATEFGATTGILPTNQIIRNVPAPVLQEQTAAATPAGGTTPGGPTPLERQPQNNALLWNDVQQARWDLDTSGSESEFEENRGTLRRETIAFYDAEIERIKELGLSLDEEKDKLEDNSLAREKALYRIDEMENRYATDRIKREEAEAAEKEKTLEVEAAEKAKALEAEAAEKAALQEKIEAIYLDAFDVEVDRLDRLKALNREYYEDLADLAETAQEKIFNSTLRGDRKLEDLRHRLARTMFEGMVSFGDLTDAQKAEVTGSLSYQRAEFDVGLGRSRSRSDLRREFGQLQGGTSGHQFYLEQIQQGTLTDPRQIRDLFGRRGAGLAEGYNEDMMEINMDASSASTELAISLQELKTPVDLLKESIVELNSAVGSGGAVGGGGGGGGTPTHPIIYVMIDSEQIITPNFVEKVNDQVSVNVQNGVGIR